MTADSTDLVRVERDGHIATVVLNRPEKLNAMTKPMWERLGAVMVELSTDDGQSWTPHEPDQGWPSDFAETAPATSENQPKTGTGNAAACPA